MALFPPNGYPGIPADEVVTTPTANQPNGYAQLNGSGDFAGNLIVTTGTAAQLSTLLLSAGQPFWTTDTSELFIGNGALVGGLQNVVYTTTHSIQIGTGATASGQYASAIGNHASASGSYASASGYNASASGFFASASGPLALASGNHASARGYNASASGNYASASGNAASASGFFASAIGNHASASGYNASASGFFASASGNYASASGFFASASGNNSWVWGASASSGYTHRMTFSGATVTISGDFSTQFSAGETVCIFGGLQPLNTTVVSSTYTSPNTVVVVSGTPPAGSTTISNTTRGANAFVFGPNNHGNAPSASAVGANISNNTANSFQIGFSDTTKTQFDATNGITNYSGQINPGNATLATGTKGLEAVKYRSAITSFTAAATTNIMTVPTGFMLVIKSISILTMTYGTVSTTQASITVGNTTTNNAYLNLTQLASLPTSTNAVGGLVTVVVANNAIVSGTEVTFTVATATNATAQTGCVILDGELVPTS